MLQIKIGDFDSDENTGVTRNPGEPGSQYLTLSSVLLLECPPLVEDKQESQRSKEHQDSKRGDID